jgi:hypothetical protein
MWAFCLDGKGNHLFQNERHDIAPVAFWEGALSVVQEYTVPYDLNHTPFGQLGE